MDAKLIALLGATKVRLLFHDNFCL